MNDELIAFLEETLPQIVTANTKALYAVAVDYEGNPKTVYYHCSSVERLTVLGAILYDAGIAFVEDNKEQIKEIMDREETE